MEITEFHDTRVRELSYTHFSNVVYKGERWKEGEDFPARTHDDPYF